MILPFVKMQGAGNDFMVVNAVETPFRLTADDIRRLADRRFGVGFDQLLVVEKPEQIENLPVGIGEKLCVVSQTTFNYKKFQDLVEKFEKKGYDILVLNTICNATQERQVEAMRIASQVDVMLVIGGKHSSNTQKLYDICRKECNNTYYIQTLGDFNPECISSVRSVGITAGASTPNNIIEEVHTKCQS